MAFSQCGGTHHVKAQCWRCSDKLPWWREVRIKAGLGAEPPLQHPNWTPAPEPAWRCIDCGETITARGKTGRCQPCSAARTVAIERMKQAGAIRRTPLAERYGSVAAR